MGIFGTGADWGLWAVAGAAVFASEARGARGVRSLAGHAVGTLVVVLALRAVMGS